jgi:hypothetical protein
MLSFGTKTVLLHLLREWQAARAAESDPVEHRAFGAPCEILERALARPDANHADFREAIRVCPAYPNWGRSTLVKLADAERDGMRVEVAMHADGKMTWEIIPGQRGEPPGTSGTR